MRRPRGRRLAARRLPLLDLLLVSLQIGRNLLLDVPEPLVPGPIRMDLRLQGHDFSLPLIPDAAFASQLCSPRDDARQAGVKLVECRVAVTVVCFDELYDAVAGRCLLALVALEL